MRLSYLFVLLFIFILNHELQEISTYLISRLQNRCRCRGWISCIRKKSKERCEKDKCTWACPQDRSTRRATKPTPTASSTSETTSETTPKAIPETTLEKTSETTLADNRDNITIESSHTVYENYDESKDYLDETKHLDNGILTGNKLHNTNNMFRRKNKRKRNKKRKKKRRKHDNYSKLKICAGIHGNFE